VVANRRIGEQVDNGCPRHHLEQHRLHLARVWAVKPKVREQHNQGAYVPPLWPAQRTAGTARDMLLRADASLALTGSANNPAVAGGDDWRELPLPREFAVRQPRRHQAKTVQACPPGQW
jgi:hypothetical protein